MIRKKISKKELAMGSLIAIFIIFVLTFYIWNHMESIRIGYEIGRSEERLSALREEVNKLQTKKAALLALERVEKTAKKDLRLREPKENQIIYKDYDPLP
jgi:cell division protein FtsL